MISDLPTIVAVIVTGAVTALAQIYREGRARRWLEQDRATLQMHMTRQDTALSNTRDAAERAYTEANHVNVKIANLTRETLELEKRVEDEEKG